MSQPPRNIDAEGVVIVGRLSDDEYADLERLETIVSRGRSTFFDVGAALAEIRDRRLYRETHPTFATYLEEQWDMAKSQAYRLINAAEVIEGLSPAGDIPPPPSERATRALGEVPPEQRDEVLAEANEDGPATEKKIRAAAQRRSDPEPEPEQPDRPSRPAPGFTVQEQRAVDHANRLAQQLFQHNPRLMDEKTVDLLEAVCQRWREKNG